MNSNIFSSSKPFSAVSKARTSTNAGAVSIVNSQRCGKRIVISSKLMNSINNPEKILIQQAEGGILIGTDIPDTTQWFTTKKQGQKGVIYSASLVDEITRKFNLQFDSRVCITLSNFEMIENYNTAFIPIENE